MNNELCGVKMTGPLVEGSKVRIFASKAGAQRGARALGWPVKCVTRVHTRFQICWALGTGVDLDPYTDLPWVSREWFGELAITRNGREGTEAILQGA